MKAILKLLFLLINNHIEPFLEGYKSVNKIYFYNFLYKHRLEGLFYYYLKKQGLLESGFFKELHLTTLQSEYNKNSLRNFKLIALLKKFEKELAAGVGAKKVAFSEKNAEFKGELDFEAKKIKINFEKVG